MISPTLLTGSSNTTGIIGSSGSAQFVELVERILKREAHRVKPRDGCVLSQAAFVESECAQTGAALGERRRHAVQRADAVEQGADRTVVLLQVIRAIRVEADVDAVR